MLRLVGCLYYLYQWCTVKQISDNEIYLLIKYIKSALWRVAKCLSYIEEARCIKVKLSNAKSSLSWKILYRQIIKCAAAVTQYITQDFTILCVLVSLRSKYWNRCLFVRPSVLIKQHDNHWSEFYEISHSRNLLI